MSKWQQMLASPPIREEESPPPIPPTPNILATDEPLDASLQGEVTLLLGRISTDEGSATNLLMPLIYDELRRIARSSMRRERADHTLQPTALVHEAYLRLAGQKNADWQSRGHFFSMAARMMRRILVDSARTRLRHKRGSGAEHEELIEAEIRDGGVSLSPVDLLALNQALERLAEIDGRMVRIVELRFFAGLGTAEIADLLGISKPTVKRSWSAARAWLARYFGEVRR